MSTPEQPDTAVVVRDKLGDVQRIGGLLAASGYFADAREMAQAAVKVMAGEELGVPPIASMMGINVIKGKITMSGNLIASRIKAHGFDYKITRLDKKGCVLTFFSKPGTDGSRKTLGESSFTEEDAKAAKVFGDMYNKYPRNMYFNRALSNGAKWYTPDVFGGIPVYVPEELGAKVDGEGDVIEPPADPAPPTTAVQPEPQATVAQLPEGSKEAARLVCARKFTDPESICNAMRREKDKLIEFEQPEGSGEVIYYVILTKYKASNSNAAIFRYRDEDGAWKSTIEAQDCWIEMADAADRSDADAKKRAKAKRANKKEAEPEHLFQGDFTDKEKNDLAPMLMSDGTIVAPAECDGLTATEQFVAFLDKYEGTKADLMKQAAQYLEEHDAQELQQSDAGPVAE